MPTIAVQCIVYSINFSRSIVILAQGTPNQSVLLFRKFTAKWLKIRKVFIIVDIIPTIIMNFINCKVFCCPTIFCSCITIYSIGIIMFVRYAPILPISKYGRYNNAKK